MAALKHIKVMSVLEDLIAGLPLGRIQRATACCPITKSLLQPMWAWKMVVQTMGRADRPSGEGAGLSSGGICLEQYAPFLPKSPYAVAPVPHVMELPSLVASTSPPRIAALELFGILLLCRHLLHLQGILQDA